MKTYEKHREELEAHKRYMKAAKRCDLRLKHEHKLQKNRMLNLLKYHA